MTSTQQNGLSSERVRDPPSSTINHLNCSICRQLLCKPIACQECETPFCSTCINRWLINNPTGCPNQCATFIERKCPPFVAKLLAQLQMACFYQSNGCEEVLPYEALDKHEIECSYRVKQCSDCTTQILTKDFSSHLNDCELFPLTCTDCQLGYKHHESTMKHTENMFLRKQIEQLKCEFNESKYEIPRLTQELRQLPFCLIRQMIALDDFPSAAHKLMAIPNTYKGLKWSKFSYIHESFVTKMHHCNLYSTSFMPDDSLHAALFSEDASISVEPPNETFTLISFSAFAALYDGLELTVTTYRKQIAVNTHHITLLRGESQSLVLHWKNIDKIVFKPSDGTAHYENVEEPRRHVVITELIIDNLSEQKTNS